MKSFAFIFASTFLARVDGLTPSVNKGTVSVITGASGFVGRHVVYSLLGKHTATSPVTSDDCIICLVRPNRVENEQCYWDTHLNNISNHNRRENEINGDGGFSIKVMPYDMLDDGTTISNALQSANDLTPEKICLYHIASTFGPTKHPIQTAHDNVKSAVDAFAALANLSTQNGPSGAATKLRMILTSSMAAVRATNQTPLNTKYYTYKDWNTISKLDDRNWGSCYQWSKMESERQVLDLVLNWNAKHNNELEFVALCPSFVFGPPPPYFASSITKNNNSGGGSTSFSVELVKQWLSGESEVQSRLCADVRDVALAHVQAGTVDLSLLATDTPKCYRYIISTEERLSSEKVGNALKSAIRKLEGTSSSFDLSKIRCDTNFDGGAIKIGEKEVDAIDRLKELGVACRRVEETMEDMAAAFVLKQMF